MSTSSPHSGQQFVCVRGSRIQRSWGPWGLRMLRAWTRPGLDRPGLDKAWPGQGLAWTGLAWTGLAWTGLAWTGLGAQKSIF